MGMPCESSYYESHPKTSTEKTPEQEQRFLAEMVEDFRADALLSASRTTGIDRRFWLTIADKLAA